MLSLQTTAACPFAIQIQFTWGYQRGNKYFHKNTPRQNENVSFLRKTSLCSRLHHQQVSEYIYLLNKIIMDSLYSKRPHMEEVKTILFYLE